MIWWGEKKNLLDFWLKGAIEKCVGCFLVYPFKGSLFLLKKEKWVLQDEKFRFALGTLLDESKHTTTTTNFIAK